MREKPRKPGRGVCAADLFLLAPFVRPSRRSPRANSRSGFPKFAGVCWCFVWIAYAVAGWPVTGRNVTVAAVFPAGSDLPSVDSRYQTASGKGSPDQAKLRAWTSALRTNRPDAPAQLRSRPGPDGCRRPPRSLRPRAAPPCPGPAMRDSARKPTDGSGTASGRSPGRDAARGLRHPR